MSHVKSLLVSAVVSVLVAGAASADGNHDQNGRGGGPAGGMYQDGMDMGNMRGGGQDMMQMMAQMHRGMMGGGMAGMGGGGMMGGGMAGMGGPLPGLDADADGDGQVTAEELHETLQALLGQYDADGNAALSLDEFAALHAALIRETVVDRFQFLDDDGDGQVTQNEIVKPADMLDRMQSMRPGQMRNQGGMMEQDRMMERSGEGRMDDN